MACPICVPAWDTSVPVSDTWTWRLLEASLLHIGSLYTCMSMYRCFSVTDGLVYIFLGCEEHVVRGSEVFVGGLARNATESKIREVCHLLIDCHF